MIAIDTYRQDNLVQWHWSILTHVQTGESNTLWCKSTNRYWHMYRPGHWYSLVQWHWQILALVQAGELGTLWCKSTKIYWHMYRQENLVLCGARVLIYILTHVQSGEFGTLWCKSINTEWSGKKWHFLFGHNFYKCCSFPKIFPASGGTPL